MDRLQLAIFKEIDGIPPEIQVIPFGYHETDKGPFELDEAGAAMVMAEFEKQKNDMVIDYEHQTLTGGEAPAAGWIKKLINKDREGIWAVVEWTGKAREYLSNREYRYVSPVFWKTEKEGRVIELINVALTNQPAIDGMVPVVNKKRTSQGGNMDWFKKLCELLAMKADTTQEQMVTAIKDLVGKAKELVAMKEALGLKPEASGDDAKAAIVAMKATPGDGGVVVVAHKDVLDVLGLPEGTDLSVVKGTIMALKKGSEGAGDMAKQLAEMKARLDGRDADDLVRAAMKAGKVTPAMESWAREYAKDDPKGFEAFVAKAPVLVQTREIMDKEGPGRSTVPDDVQMSVNKALGVSDESFKKFGPDKKED